MNTMTRFPSRREWFAALLCLTGLTVGLVAGLLPAAPPTVLAHGTCQAANAGCGGDPTKTGVLDVLHFKNGSTAVEPNTGESWSITAHWNPIPGSVSCAGTHETASVDVDWNGAGWTLSNTSLTTNIVGISVCDIGGSCFSTTGARAYRLLVDVNDPIAIGTQHLQEVSFATTSVDNGLEFDMMNPCTITTNVANPTSQNFAASDVGAFECAFNCNATGAIVTITY